MEFFKNHLEDSLKLNEESKKKIKKGIEDIKKKNFLTSKEALAYFKKK